jgi:hypothetical protein
MRKLFRGTLTACSLLAAGCGVEPGDANIDQTKVAVHGNALAYTPVDVSIGPANYDFWAPLGVSDNGELLGQGIECDDEFVVCTFDLLKRQTNGTFVLVAEDFSVNDVTSEGDVGGCVVDPETGIPQAAIVDKQGALELLPRLVGEEASCVVKIGSDRVAAVVSQSGTAFSTYVFDKGRVVPLPLDPFEASVQDINAKGQVAGIIDSDPDAQRAFRFDAGSQTLTLLEPNEGDPHSWGQGIDKHGNVLGYSFAFNGVERIGSWNEGNEFEVSFVEGTAEFPTISNRLIWNDAGLIVVSQSNNDPNTYLIPEPGVRLNLADLVGGAPFSSNLYALSINKRGDLLAVSDFDGSSFLFLRQ